MVSNMLFNTVNNVVSLLAVVEMLHFAKILINSEFF